MANRILRLFFLVLLLLMAGCGDEKRSPSERTQSQILADQKDNLYRELARLKGDIMEGHLDGWRAKLDAIWIHGDIIDSQIAEYINEVKRIALQKEKELEDVRRKSDLIVEPSIDENVTVTEEIITAYLQEVLAGIEAGTLKKWETYLDKVYLHGNKLTEEHLGLIQKIEEKGEELNKTLRPEAEK